MLKAITDCKHQLFRYLLVLICAVYAGLIWWQHQYVFLQFDDFGYVSLSYHSDNIGRGIHYSFDKIIQFLIYNYFTWGGRSLYFLFEIICIRYGGLVTIQNVQAIILIGVCVLAGIIGANARRSLWWPCVALSLVLYGMISLTSAYDGLYWLTASVLYAWPLLPLFAGLLLLRRHRGTLHLTPILFFLAAFSQEQMAVLAVVSVGAFLLFSIFHQDKFTKMELTLNMVAVLVGASLCIFCPGNFIRATTAHADYYTVGLIARTFNNFANIIYYNFGTHNAIFCLLLTAVAGLYFLAMYPQRSAMIMKVTMVSVALFVCELVVNSDGMIFGFFWAMVIIPVFLVEFYRRSNYLLVSLILGGVASQALMLIAPNTGIRTHMMMQFVLHIVMITLCGNFFSSVWLSRHGVSAMSRYCVVLLLVMLLGYSLKNHLYIINGYRENYATYLHNDQILWASSRSHARALQCQQIKLSEYPNPLHANVMPYYSGHEYIEDWMKAYYELPEETYLHWLPVE
ncbi:hypothetical protein IJJ08_04235 [bacterium]|nr:hypothetical protein [bacterium]